MDTLKIPLFLLNLTKQEIQLVLFLFLIYENHTDKQKYTLEEIAKLSGLSKVAVEDILNKLSLKNIVGRIVYEQGLTKRIRENFDEAFLNILYDKNDPLESAKQKAKFYIDNVDTMYVLNPVFRSWIYSPKVKMVKMLKKLNKISNDPFVEYLLKSFNYGEKDDKRRKINSKLHGWNINESVEIFRSMYRVRYGNTYNLNPRDHTHMKQLLTQLAINKLPKDRLDIFFEYAFDRAVSRDYVLGIVGLKYYVNEYTSNLNKV